MNVQAAVEEALKTIQRCAILAFLRHMASGSGHEVLEETTASEFVQVCFDALEGQGETPQNEIQWHAYAMRLLEKHGYPQDAKDELMAIITGLRGGV